MTSLETLLATPTEQALKERLRGLLQEGNFPVTDWLSGAVGRSIWEMETAALLELVANMIPVLARAGFSELASGDWLTLLSYYLYDNARVAASFTLQSCVLTCAAGAGPYTLQPGDVVAKSTAGLEYLSVTGGTLNTSSTLAVTMQSRFVNDSANGLDYADGAGTLTQLVTALPGVTISNPAPEFDTVTLVGVGNGIVATSRTNPVVAPSACTLRIRIDSNGDIGSATFSYSISGGAWVFAGAMPATFDVPATGIRLTFTNGAATPSFVLDDIYYGGSPGTPIVQRGADEESDAELQLRNREKWASLAEVPTDDLYALWAKRVAPVVRLVKVEVDGVQPGKVNLTIAGRGYALPAGVVATVQADANARKPVTDRPVVASATPQAITISAIIKLNRKDLAAHQAAAQRAIASLVASKPLDPTIYLAEIIDELRSPSAGTTKAIDVPIGNILINGVAANLVLSGGKVASFSQVLSTTLSWVVV